MCSEVPPSSLAHTKPCSKPLKSGSNALCQQFSSSWCSCRGLGWSFSISPKGKLHSLHVPLQPCKLPVGKGRISSLSVICVVGKVTTDIYPSSADLIQGLKSLGRFPMPSQAFITAHSSTSVLSVSSSYIKPFKVSKKKSILRLFGFIQLITW